jgi:hypothetical protein
MISCYEENNMPQTGHAKKTKFDNKNTITKVCRLAKLLVDETKQNSNPPDEIDVNIGFSLDDVAGTVVIEKNYNRAPYQIQIVWKKQ